MMWNVSDSLHEMVNLRFSGTAISLIAVHAGTDIVEIRRIPMLLIIDIAISLRKAVIRTIDSHDERFFLNMVHQILYNPVQGLSMQLGFDVFPMDW